MNEQTPQQNKLNQNLVNIGTPLGENKYNNIDILNLKEEEKKFKTISHLKQYNNITNDNLNNISLKLFDDDKEKGNYLNNTASIINNNDKKNEKINYKLKIKSMPKNRKSSIPEAQSGNKIKNNKINILSKSSNDMTKFKKIIKNQNIILTENNKKKPEDDDSENLSALAEDLLSMSDENVQIMRKGPINKNDFIGESKELFNLYKKQENRVINVNMNKNKININQTKPMPKLQTKLYSSPLDKFNIKNSTNLNNIKNSNKKNYNNINSNLTNFQLNDRNNMQYNKTQMQTTQISTENARPYASKVKNHISSNSIQNGTNINNNININVNINSNNNNTILSNLISRNQATKNNVTGNNINQIINNYDMFSKTGLNQYNNNYILEFDENNLNNINKIKNNHSVGKKKMPLNMNIKNNSNSNRNIKNKSIIKQINSTGLHINLNTSNDFMNKSNLNINNNNAQYINNINKNIIFNRTNMNINNINNMNNKIINTNYQQNFNLMNNNNYHSNDNYNYNHKINNFSIGGQALKKTQTLNWVPQNNNPNLENNIEYKHKNINNINMNKRSVINSYANNYNNNYHLANKLDYVSHVQNKPKNLQSDKLLRQSDYNKISNKNNLLLLDGQDNILINNNNVNNQQIYLDNNLKLIKGKNKNSYTNIHNYLDMNGNKIRKNNLYNNNNDMISQKLATTFNLKNFGNRGYLNENIYTYDGQGETVDYI